MQIILQATNGTEWQKKKNINTYVMRHYASNKCRINAHASEVFGYYTTGLFQLQMRISFPFLRAKDLRRFLLIMGTRISSYGE